MQFCEVCDNMYYIKISSTKDNELMYYCKKCGNENNNITEDNMCVLTTNFKKKDTKYKHIINKYTKLDPTLPRMNHIQCPNEECKSRSENPKDKLENEIIYMRYDDTNIKYVYLCANCDYVWTTNS